MYLLQLLVLELFIPALINVAKNSIPCNKIELYWIFGKTIVDLTCEYAKFGEESTVWTHSSMVVQRESGNEFNFRQIFWASRPLA